MLIFFTVRAVQRGIRRQKLWQIENVAHVLIFLFCKSLPGSPHMQPALAQADKNVPILLFHNVKISALPPWVWKKKKLRYFFTVTLMVFFFRWNEKISAAGARDTKQYGGKASIKVFLVYDFLCKMAERQVQSCSWIIILLAIWRKGKCRAAPGL